MKKSIQRLSSEFITDWERKNIEMDFSLRFPQLHEFVFYINNTLPKQEKENLFVRKGIYRILKLALYRELQSIMEIE